MKSLRGAHSFENWPMRVSQLSVYSRTRRPAHICVLLLLLASISLRGQLASVHASSLQPDIVESVLIRNVNVLLSRDKFHLDVAAHALDRSEVDGLDGIGALGAPGKIMSASQRSRWGWSSVSQIRVCVLAQSARWQLGEHQDSRHSAVITGHNLSVMRNGVYLAGRDLQR